MNKNAFSQIWIIVIVAVLLSGGIFAWQYLNETETSIQKPVSNILQGDSNGLVVEEDSEHAIYKGIIYGYKNPFNDYEYTSIFAINGSEIDFKLDFDYDSCGTYSVKGNVDSVYLDEGDVLKKLSLQKINELNEEEVLSVTIIVRKNITFLEKIRDFFEYDVFASCYHTLGEIENPEKIIFKKPEKKEILLTGMAEGGMTGYLWSFELDDNQGVHVRKFIGPEISGKEHLFTEVTYPSSYLIKFENDPSYFEVPINNFSQNIAYPDLLEEITVKGEENCPDFGMPCLIKAETVEVKTNLLLEDEKIYKPVTTSGVISYVFCQNGPDENGKCHFWLENSRLKENTVYITNSTQFITGDAQSIKVGKNVTEVTGKIECPSLTDILSESPNAEENFVECKFIASTIEFEKKSTPAGIEESDKTADWQTYTNQEYGFEIEYQKEWTAEVVDPSYWCYKEQYNCLAAFKFFPPSTRNYSWVNLIIYGNPDEYSTLEWLNKYIPEVWTDRQIQSFDAQIKIGGEYGAKMVSTNGCKAEITYVAKGKNLFSIRTCFGSGQEETEDIFGQMLSSFNFIETSENTGIKTYKNTEYGFEIEYPAGYAISGEEKEYGTDFGEEGIQILEIQPNQTIVSSDCYSSSVEKIYVRINESETAENDCSKEDVFSPTAKNDPLKQELKNNLTENGWSATKEVNDIDFYRRFFVTHSMGGKADSDYAYQVFHDGKCYKIGVEVHSGYSFGFKDECPLSLSDSEEYETIRENEDESIQGIFFPILSGFSFLE